MPAEITIQFGVDPGAAADGPLEVEVINSDLEIRASGVYHLRHTPTFIVEPGLYLVRGRLPSGEWMRTQINLTDGSIADVVLRPLRSSPRNDLARSYFLRANPLLEDASTSRNASMESLLNSYAPGPVNHHIWRSTPNGNSVQVVSRTIGAGPYSRIESLDPAQDPRALAIIHVDQSQFEPNEPPNSQYWLTLDGDWFTPRSVVLPTTTVPTKVLLRFVGNQQGHRDPLQVNVDIRPDPVVESLLNLITAGEYGAARTIGTSNLPEVDRLLIGANEDPMAAAVGGYFLLLAGDFQHMRSWIAKFDDRFPGFPDVAVIHAWYLLRGHADLNVACDRLTNAASRGIPFYTCGLRLLIDGLMLFKEQVDLELNPRKSRRVARRLGARLGVRRGCGLDTTDDDGVRFDPPYPEALRSWR